MVGAYVMIMTGSGTAPDVISRIREIDGVKQAHVVAGEFDVIAEVEAESDRDLLSLVTGQIQSIEGVGRTRTCIVLD